MKESEEKLRRTQRLDAIGQLTGGIAHDFNNILAIILGSVELLEHLKDDDEKLLTGIRNAAERGSKLTHRLLAYSRRQPLQSKPVDLASLVAGMTDLLRRTLGVTIKIETSSEEGLWRATADPGQIEDSLLNLAINGRDAMEGDGTLTIRWCNVHIEANAVSEGVEIRPGDYVLLVVGDTGCGMADEVKVQVFEPFFTTKGVGKGSGLGLSMVHGFAAQSNGHVRMDSELGKGTRVELYLPRSRREEEQVELGVPVELPQGEGGRILVVEDDPDVRRLTMETLARLGYNATGAGDAAEAQRMVAESEPFGLILSDVVLAGGVSGPQMADELWEKYADLKIIFMSGYPAENIQNDRFLRPDSILLGKPVRRRDLAFAIQKALK
jgi:CheY-like chemotaxis protein